MKPFQWVLVGLTTIAVVDSLWVRHQSLKLAKELAEREFETATESLPGDSDSLQGISQASRFLGRCKPRTLGRPIY